MSEALHIAGVLASTNLDELVKSVSCDANRKSCAYDECEDCVIQACTMIDFSKVDSTDLSYKQWVSKVIWREVDGAGVSSKIIVKDDLTERCDHFVDTFESRLHVFKKHSFNIRNHYQDIRENLSGDEVLIHIDYSENYSCEYASEVQSVHFGGSHQQAYMHTGALYTQSGDPQAYTRVVLLYLVFCYLGEYSS